MSAPVSPVHRPTGQTFRHEAFFYAGDREFLEGTLGFIREGLTQGEPVMVALSAPKIARLRAELGADAGRVRFADMAEIGSNPARIIPAWHDFVGGRPAPDWPIRGIGEPIWAGRTAAELVECQRHEELLNLAFADTPAFRLLCPYDTRALGPAVIEEARCSHPILVEDRTERESTDYRGLPAVAAPFDKPLPEPPVAPSELAFDIDTLRAVRRMVSRHAAAVGMSTDRTGDLILAVDELATNSVRHGGGRGVLSVWHDGSALICEVRDHGRIDQPLVGRRCPSTDRAGGFGVWLVNQLCDLVQMRSLCAGNVVRVHMRDA
ncbi:MAG: putative signal transduction histidine kinase [Solirubrobacterales bacterium]|nr:putative signal transduction histidine kinase [Solirubrobacterales bacterium]